MKGVIELVEEDKLSRREKMDLVLEAGMVSIPHIGGALQTLYFGSKNEKRFKRIERFYKELQMELEEVKHQLPSNLDVHNKNQFLGLLESINDEVEKAGSQSKIDQYKKAYKNILLNSDKYSFENESYFIQILPILTELEIKLLYSSYISKNNLGDPHQPLNGSSVSKNLIQGSLNRLTDFGFFSKTLQGMTLGGANSGENATYHINDLGLEFISFIFE